MADIRTFAPRPARTVFRPAFALAAVLLLAAAYALWVGPGTRQPSTAPNGTPLPDARQVAAHVRACAAGVEQVTQALPDLAWSPLETELASLAEDLLATADFLTACVGLPTE